LSGLVDSHVHLDMLDDPKHELDAAVDAGVSRVLAVGTDLDSSKKAAGFAATAAGVNAAVGIHPHEAAHVGEDEIGRLESLSGLTGVVAIGETGLDYYRDRSPRHDQERAFIAQIELARRTGLTLVVHSRDASRETLRILGERAGGIKVVLHCFAMHEMVEECARSGYFMSIAGNVTFKNADALRSAAASIPAHLLLTETDSPFLSPEPKRGRPNGPRNIPLIVKTLASIRSTTADTMAMQIEANYLQAFDINQSPGS
jgi:TatD DNase family protein